MQHRFEQSLRSVLGSSVLGSLVLLGAVTSGGGCSVEEPSVNGSGNSGAKEDVAVAAQKLKWEGGCMCVPKDDCLQATAEYPDTCINPGGTEDKCSSTTLACPDGTAACYVMADTKDCKTASSSGMCDSGYCGDGCPGCYQEERVFGGYLCVAKPTTTACGIPGKGEICVTCDDSNVCTLDSCDLDRGCVNTATNEGGTCYSGSLRGVCSGGTCKISIGTGGATGSGGTTSSGGTTAKGGSTSSGGTTSLGGTTAKGGSTSSGGTTSLGGTTAKGGSTSVVTTGSGGAVGLGGSTAKGGTSSIIATSTGGALGLGGTTAKGGASSTGTTSAGGIVTSAGASAKGGSTSTGTASQGGGTPTSSGGATTQSTSGQGGSYAQGGGASSAQGGDVTGNGGGTTEAKGGNSAQGGSSSKASSGKGGKATLSEAGAAGEVATAGADSVDSFERNPGGCSCSIPGKPASNGGPVSLIVGLFAAALVGRRRSSRR